MVLALLVLLSWSFLMLLYPRILVLDFHQVMTLLFKAKCWRQICEPSHNSHNHPPVPSLPAFLPFFFLFYFPFLFPFSPPSSPPSLLVVDFLSKMVLWGTHSLPEGTESERKLWQRVLRPTLEGGWAPAGLCTLPRNSRVVQPSLESGLRHSWAPLTHLSDQCHIKAISPVGWRGLQQS